MKRASGILLHITSLPNDYGLGCFSSAAYDFIDWLKGAGFKLWQVLPFNHCAYGESPYSVFSAFAGNPYFIDLTEFLTENELKSFGFDKVKTHTNKELQDMYDLALDYIFKTKRNDYDITSFTKKHKHWLHDYAMFMTIKRVYDNVEFLNFEPTLKKRDSKALKAFELKFGDLIDYYSFLQYLFFSQWEKIKVYANKSGIKIIGDIPIYVNLDSSDVWVHQSEFLLHANGTPKIVSGVPPDYFSKDGQLWGNPIYDYKKMKENNYDWWLKRIKHAEHFFDVVRLDHFRGFVSYFGVDSQETTAKNGKWYKGPSYELLNIFKQNTTMQIIAEDLGIITNDVIKVKNKLGFYGMKIVQFAFNEGDEHAYLPHTYEKECVAYIGNHDNDTCVGFLSSLDYDRLNRIKNYVKLPLQVQNDVVTEKLIETMLNSNADLCVLMPQDMLGKSTEYRMNIPGLAFGNWKYQLKQGELSFELMKKYEALNKNAKR